MTLLIVSFIAGVLTVLAPCVLPLLPVVIGSSVGGRSKATPYIVIASLASSILLFTYLLKASTAFITIPPYVWSYLSGGILLSFGLILLFPTLWETLPFVNKASVGANKLMGAGHQKKSIWGDILVGAALGPVFSTCSPTYLVILATVLPASFFLGTLYLLSYLAGLVSVLLLIAKLGQKLTAKLQVAADSHSWTKRFIGALFILIGIFIITGYDKKLETAVLDSGYLDITRIEQKILDKVNQPNPEENMNSEKNSETSVNIPNVLQNNFPNTDWLKSDPKITNAQSGGPSKDGIPAIDKPTFVPLSEFIHSDTVQAIVLVGENETKVYPYNILTWHEIVNDKIDDVPVAVTFCPLCGSAIVYDRTLPNGTISTFGVSGSLLESNMIMYDRSTENLWQQSTGQTLAGSFHPAILNNVPFQLLSIKEIRETYPSAVIMSENTGHARNYATNPYAGYDTNDSFAFDPSNINTQFSPKTIMVVFRDNESTFVAPWLSLRAAGETNITHNDVTYKLLVTKTGEAEIIDSLGNNHPFYFEMWFSAAVQHEDSLVVIEI